MPAFRVLWRALSRAGLFLATILVALVVSACDGGLPGMGGGDPTPESAPPSAGSLGPCLPWIGNSVVAAAMDGTGNRIAFISDERPITLGDDASWSGDDRALVIVDRGTEGDYLERHIALSWAAQDAIAQYATSEPDVPTPEGIALPEQMVDVQIDRAGSRFVVAVKREGVNGNYAKLYTGSVPPTGSASLAPGEGLTIVPINNYIEGEGVQTFALSPDGTKVAATVGGQSELRVYDFDAEADKNLMVYDSGPKGGAVITHQLPSMVSMISARRTPLVSSPGAIRATWSPDSSMLAISQQDEQVAQTRLGLMDVASGKLDTVRLFKNSTVPHVAWAADSKSIFTMVTPLSDPKGSSSDTVFQDTQIVRIEAAKDGDNVGDGAEIDRVLGVRTEPTNLASFGDDERFVFAWDGRLIRLNAPGGDLAKATFIPITGDPNKIDAPVVLSSSAYPPSAAADTDIVSFLVQDGSSRHVGLRTFASEDKCPEIPTPEGGDAAGEAGAEGEAAGEGTPAADEGAAEGDAEAAATPTAE
jgi:hypothetical protein